MRTVGLSMVKQEAKWQAEHDARTIAEAEAIKSNPRRLRAAQAEAKKMLKEKEAEVAGLKEFTDKKQPRKRKPTDKSGLL